MAERLPFFATTARGTEELLAEELRELGAARIRQDRGGVRFHASLHEAMRVCLWSRIAMRILLPVAEQEVQGAEGLYDAVRDIPWEDHLSARHTIAVEATLKDSEHTHSGFVALKVKDAIVDRMREKTGSRPDVDTRRPDLQIIVHLAKQKLSVSMDVCGEPLFKRGWRVEQTIAPLKETLAAALLRASGYTGEESFLDPMCGSGTLLVEAGLIASKRPPSVGREFAIERWPSHGEKSREILKYLREEAASLRRAPPFPIWGSDKNEDAAMAARANAAAAGLAGAVHVSVADALKDFPVPTPGGLLLTNPPYGDRLEGGRGQKGMKTFYYALGNRFSELREWRQFIFVGNPGFESAFHRRPSKKRDLFNGPIACTLLGYPALDRYIDEEPPEEPSEPT